MAGNQSERKKEERRRKKKECEQKRRDKIKSDSVAYEAAKAKERERWQKRRAEKKVKTIEDMTPREQRTQRATWRKEYRAKAQLKKRQENAMRIAAENSPPTTDDESFPVNAQNLDHPVQSPPQSSGSSTPVSSASSRQKIVGQRLKKRNYSLLKRVIQKQQDTIKKLQIKINTLRVQKSRNAVRALQRNKETLPIRSRNGNRSNVPCAMRRKDVLDFLESDENSRIMPGKKDTITRNQVKKQRRLLSDTLRNLFEKFVSLGHPYKISYSTFCRLKPFWILEPNISKRETCLCSTHENFQFIIDKLHFYKLIRENTSNDVAKSVTCSSENDKCMNRECKSCCHKIPVVNTFEDGPISYKKWTKVSEQRVISGVTKKVSRIIKKDVPTTKAKLVTEMTDLMPKFLQHQHSWTHQSKTMSFLRKQLEDGEVLIHMDFSENYMCKYNQEIQSVHFGASRQQITLHTVVTYYKCASSGDIMVKSFCSLSESLRHDACAVLAHLKGILSRLLLLTSIKSLHILTDSPSTQYRNKKMFYLFANHVVEYYSFEKASWHFHEAGHGKGAPDGIGAYVKTTADRHVALGRDIEKLETLYKILTAEVQTKVEVFLVNEEEIRAADELLSQVPELNTIKNTMRVHQVRWNACEPTTIYLRRLSCLICDKECQHFGIAKYVYQRASQGTLEYLAQDDQMMAITGQIEEEYTPEIVNKRSRRRIMFLTDSETEDTEPAKKIAHKNLNSKRVIRFFSDESDSDAPEPVIQISRDESDATTCEYAENNAEIMRDVPSEKIIKNNNTIQKTKMLCFHKTSASAPQALAPLKIHTCNSNQTLCNCSEITRTNIIKYLGILVDESLNFKAYIEHLSSRVRKITCIMRQLRDVAYPTVLKQVYFALCHSLITYCLSCWGGILKTTMLSVERAQRAVIKTMLNRPRRYRTVDIYRESGFLSVRKVFILNITISVHREVLNSSNYEKLLKRRLFKVNVPVVNTSFAQRFCPFIKYYIYNKVVKACGIKDSTIREAKFKISKWLSSLTYDETEDLFVVPR